MELQSLHQLSGTRWIGIILDDFDTEALRHVVHDFYHEKKYPTLDSLLVAAKEKGIFSREHVTLWRVLCKMGFKHKKVNDKRYIYEQPFIGMSI